MHGKLVDKLTSDDLPTLRKLHKHMMEKSKESRYFRSIFQEAMAGAFQKIIELVEKRDG